MFYITVIQVDKFRIIPSDIFFTFYLIRVLSLLLIFQVFQSGDQILYQNGSMHKNKIICEMKTIIWICILQGCMHANKFSPFMRISCILAFYPCMHASNPKTCTSQDSSCFREYFLFSTSGTFSKVFVHQRKKNKTCKKILLSPNDVLNYVTCLTDF